MATLTAVSELPTEVLGAVAEFLTLQDLARWQASDCASRSHLNADGAAVWRMCTIRALPQVAVNAALFATRERPNLLRCLRRLADSRTRLARSVEPLRLHDASDVCRLAGAIATAQRTAEQHVAQGGRVAHVVVTACRFGLGGVPGSVADLGKLDLGEGKDDRVQMRMGLHDKRLLVEARCASRRSRRQLRGSESVAQAKADVRPFTAHVVSASPQLTLDFRHIALRMDGRTRRASNGIWLARNAETDATGLDALCVVCLSDGEPSGCAQSSLADVLNIDRQRARQHPL
eukprot:TRINITY_DN11073_c1_g3_i2.p2 TRINITY_DN11073_c1_g3~~TRINITY_DN11073_c1_g3_i2.p2  ORF type:complete len:289 (-),score=50.12 TRINITY_DN11073_c1_g3_i2:226-1092(-)